MVLEPVHAVAPLLFWRFKRIGYTERRHSWYLSLIRLIRYDARTIAQLAP